MRQALSLTHASNELMRCCLLRRQHERLFPTFYVSGHLCHGFSLNERILLANSNQWYFNNLVKKSCHNTHCRCPHRLNLSFQSSRSCALPNIKVLKDKDLEFANSIRSISALLL